MIISFSNTPLVLATVCLLLILGAHVLAALRGRNIARWLTLSAAVLHLPLCVLLFFAGAQLDLLVGAVLLGTLVYTLASYIAYIKRGGKDK